MITRYMKSIWMLVLFAGMLPACAQELTDNSKRTIVFDQVNVIDVENGRVLKDQQVVVRGGKIIHTGSNRIKVNDDPLVINAKGKYLIPGLAEMHAHVPPIDNLEPMKEVLLLYVFNGISTIRGMLGHPRHLELRTKIEQGEIIGPRFYTSGPSLNGQSVPSPESGAAMVRQQKNAGYDFLKLHPGLSREKFDAIAKKAKEVNIPFAGHVSFDVGVWHAIESGYASIDHLDGFVESLVPGIENMSEQETGIFGIYIGTKADTTRIPGLMEALRKNNIWVVPTQALAERWFAPEPNAETLRNAPEMKYVNPATLDNWVNSKKNLVNNPKYNAGEVNRFVDLRRKLIYACNQHKVGLLLGSDAPQVFNVPGFSVHHELKYLVDAGLTPYEALRTGTLNVGRYFNRTDIGIIKTGAISDLILLNGNPLEDIEQTKNIEGVMLRNLWMPKAYIEKQLKMLEK